MEEAGLQALTPSWTALMLIHQGAVVEEYRLEVLVPECFQEAVAYKHSKVVAVESNQAVAVVRKNQQEVTIEFYLEPVKIRSYYF